MKAKWILAAVVMLGAIAPAVLQGDPAVTIYNQNFAVVRDVIPLDLKQGVNNVRFADTTAHLEPESVILRDPAGKHALQILEQNYRADPVSEKLLLSLYEGKTIEFLVQRQDRTEIVKGKIIRSGHVPRRTTRQQRYGRSGHYPTSSAYGRGQPIVEVDGKLRFNLPGTPLFPALADDTILKPMLHWLIETDKGGRFTAEVCYVTGGMSWNADYNLVSPEKGDTVDLVGWVTIDNQSGKSFPNAKLKLMAGDVSKMQPDDRYRTQMLRASSAKGAGGMRPPVSEKAFDEYHLYTVRRRTTLRDRETKQVEFARAAGVKSQRLYVYDGSKTRYGYPHRYGTSPNQGKSYGTQSNPKVWVMREFKNTEANGLGIPLPRGRVRFYRRDDDGQLEFTGENIIDHTPRDETIRVYVGNAFDLVGERKRTNYQTDRQRHWVDESFEIKVRNHKKEQVEVRVVEHLYRWSNWEITEKSNTYLKTDSRTIEFRVQIRPDEEKVITYSVHYSW